MRGPLSHAVAHVGLDAVKLSTGRLIAVNRIALYHAVVLDE
jgi:hypothetical protein